eukprot:scpid110359/ scgid7804/ 
MLVICGECATSQHLLTHVDVAMAIVTETKLSPEKATQAEVTIPGYYPPIRRDRMAQGGGVANTADQEVLWVSITTHTGTRMAVCAAYRPGTCPDHDTTMFTHLESNIDIARQSCSHIVVVGDFNVHNHEWLG